MRLELNFAREIKPCQWGGMACDLLSRPYPSFLMSYNVPNIACLYQINNNPMILASLATSFEDCQSPLVIVV